MNKKRTKKIRQEAATFVKSLEEFRRTEMLTGSQLLERGVEEVEGKEVSPRDRYTRSVIDVRFLDHEKKLKKFYNKFGADKYLHEYNIWFEMHHKNMIKKYPKHFKKKES